MRIGIIGGSGIGEALTRRFGSAPLERACPRTPFGFPSGDILVGDFLADPQRPPVPIALLARHGDGHVLPPASVPNRANIFALKLLGVTHIIATGAVGSLREEIAPGDLVVCDQVIDRTVARERSFFEKAAVHVELADPFCPVMRRWLIETAAEAGLRAHSRATYLAMEGPAFSTRAESRAHRAMGADLVGMTAMPEARLAREAEIAYALLALATDWDSWKERPATDPSAPGAAAEESLLAEIIANLGRASDAASALLGAALTRTDSLIATPSPAHSALKLAIWSQKAKIEPAEVQRLRPLWGKYFSK